MLHMGLGPLVLSATTSSYETYAACCDASNLEQIFDLFYAELNETMGLAQGEQFWQTVNSIPVTFCLQKQKRH